jgi:hypothetical protein
MQRLKVSVPQPIIGCDKKGRLVEGRRFYLGSENFGVRIAVFAREKSL